MTQNVKILDTFQETLILDPVEADAYTGPYVAYHITELQGKPKLLMKYARHTGVVYASAYQQNIDALKVWQQKYQHALSVS